MIADDAVVIGLGGNIGDDVAIIERFVRAREAFAEIGDVKSAQLYRSAAFGPIAQQPFLNSAIRVRWPDAIGEELIATVLEIERLLGRDRRGEARWGPRKIDLDVLVWGTRVIRKFDLQLPHGGIGERRFVLLPLIDLVGEDTLLPGTHETLGAYAAVASDQQVELIQSVW